MSRSKGRRTLPDNPSLEQLREQAKDRLAIIRTHTPESQLSDAQFALARDYGFPGWRALKAEVDRRSGAINGLVGYYAEASVSNNVLSVTAKGGRLFLEIGKGATIEIIPQHDGTFASPGLTRRYRIRAGFERQGPRVYHRNRSGRDGPGGTGWCGKGGANAVCARPGCQGRMARPYVH